MLLFGCRAPDYGTNYCKLKWIDLTLSEVFLYFLLLKFECDNETQLIKSNIMKTKKSHGIFKVHRRD